MMSYIALASLLWLSVSFSTSNPTHETFMQCMSTQFGAYTKSVQIVFHTSNSSIYSNLLQSSQQNPRWLNSTTARPLLIITPFHESEIQAAILCSKKHGLQIRVRSGGHDYEGLSYRCKTPFIIVDLINLRSVELNLADETAWVQSGATLGELYYRICPSVGVGGHFSGGGFGTLLRKYGLAADNVLDAYLIDVNGEILNRKAMGEDLFWAIRGGGGASFGIVLSWKIKLVRLPPIVTGFTISKTLEQGATKLVSRWQYIADRLHEDLFIRVIVQDVGNGSKKTIQASFNSLFLGGIERLIPLMNESFPELGLQAQDCNEMSWIQSVLYFSGYQKGDHLEVLLDRSTLYKSFFKAKSDFVQEPIPEVILEEIWERFLEEQLVFIIMDPFGGQMNEISESEIPFPHRKGNIYNIQYLVKWEVNGITASSEHINWIRLLYDYMRPYVSKHPTAAYLNYRDLDLGANKPGNTSYLEARVWGTKYFKGNFKRLTKVKTKVDPDNIFRNEQSIPVCTAPNFFGCN
ncbi:berberine bridge enzyme-like 22 [Juglans regia]|uniref:Berberine bridge enzyme-like 22 n=1 Tax=Juglans regia TaxID=51240 RepID=A0A6P9EPU9_JUGRE|nr:berberine bridge enzyme-like 22 [Juglans regia]